MDIIEKELFFTNLNKDKVYAKLLYVKFIDMKDLIEVIDNEIVDIMYADSIYSLKQAKSDIKNILENKTVEQKHGAVAEFFSHIVLRNKGFVQQCLFRNLEEKSMKKGFDGLYSLNYNFWIMESKSAITDQLHKSKIYEAINDIKKRVEDLSKNNPWINAANHIMVLQNGKDIPSILKKIKRLSLDFINKRSHYISEFKIIPVSTLFIKNKQDLNETINDITKLLTGSLYDDIIVVCIDNYLFDCFLNYLDK